MPANRVYEGERVWYLSHHAVIIDKKLLAHGGFSLVKFVVNNQLLLTCIPVTLRSKEMESLSLECRERYLRVKWMIVIDAFVFQIGAELQDLVTRRKNLSLLSSMFDSHLLLG